MSNCDKCEHGCHCSNGGSCTSCECKDCNCKKEEEEVEVTFDPDFSLTIH